MEFATLIVKTFIEMENENKISISKKDITGKIAGITEENGRSIVKMILENFELNIVTDGKYFELGDRVRFDAEMEIKNIEKG